jgi:polysaccharide export outer membrane protein
MNDLKNDSSYASNLLKAKLEFQTLIQKNDQLWINVGGPNSTDLIALNSGMGVSGMVGGGAFVQQGGQVLGYFVEADGSIKLPYIGKVYVEGLTRSALEDTLQRAFSEYTKDPIVNVRFMNYKVTVLGEVNRPGTFSIPNERMTILEAIGMAGDLTIFGQRNEILIVREVNGKREFGRLDLLSKDIVQSPFYYLKTNDVIYVEPAPARFFARERIPQFLSIAGGALSVIAIILSITK